MHNGMIRSEGEKMAKSVGNIAALHEVLDAWPRETIIAYFLTSHYRSKLPFSDDRLVEAGHRCERIRNGLRALDAAIASPGEGTSAELTQGLMQAHTEFFAALRDDFNTPQAFAALDAVVRAVNLAVESDRPAADQLREAKRMLLELLDVLALTSLDAPDDALPDVVRQLADARVAARAAKDFAASDRLRDEIQVLGFEVRDAAEGQQVYRS
jgi:cysteinyl-tRNA synthetase